MTVGYTIAGTPAPYWVATLKPAVTVSPAMTHLVVEGTVAYRKSEADGDLHFDITDANGLKLVCEITPQHPLPMPALGQRVRVYGIYRADPDHGGWPELHPVDHWEDAAVTPTPYVAP